MSAEKTTQAFDSNSLVLPGSGVNVRYRTVDSDARYTLEVHDPNDQQELQEKLGKQLNKDFWFLSPEIRAEELKHRFGIRLDENTEVELFNFDANFGPEQLTEVASTLAYYYHSLKDESLWTLTSIQVRSQNDKNNKSGQPFRGKEFPQQQRFELFPASFEAGKFRGTMNCTMTQGSVTHETTHVVLERVLEKLWSQNRNTLGWELLDDQLLILPGGTTTAYYNNDYENLPSDYAANQPDDDRAESVAAFLLDPEKANEVRKSILNQVLEPSIETPFEVIQKETVLPELPEITVKLTEPLASGFKIGKVTYNQNPKPPITLEEYREMRKNQQDQA